MNLSDLVDLTNDCQAVPCALDAGQLCEGNSVFEHPPIMQRRGIICRDKIVSLNSQYGRKQTLGDLVTSSAKFGNGIPFGDIFKSRKGAAL